MWFMCCVFILLDLLRVCLRRRGLARPRSSRFSQVRDKQIQNCERTSFHYPTSNYKCFFNHSDVCWSASSYAFFATGSVRSARAAKPSRARVSRGTQLDRRRCEIP